MNTFYAALAAVVITVISEGILWILFEQKMRPLEFPHELDTSYFRFFSLRRLQIIAVFHAVILAGSLTVFCWYLW